MALATITSKGQVTIPKSVRERLGVKNGDKVDFRVGEDGTVTVVPITRTVEGEPAPFIATPANEIDGRFSADGRWIAYVSDHSGNQEVYVRPSGGGGEITMSSGGGTDPEWHPGQSTLFFVGLRADGEGRAVFAVDLADGTASAVRELAPFPSRSSPLFIVAHDGERFMTAMTGGAADESPAQLRIVLNPDGS